MSLYFPSLRVVVFLLPDFNLPRVDLGGYCVDGGGIEGEEETLSRFMDIEFHFGVYMWSHRLADVALQLLKSEQIKTLFHRVGSFLFTHTHTQTHTQALSLDLSLSV